MKAEIGSFGGAPAVFLDGKPVTALMHWTRNPQSADTVLFRNEGVHFYSFMGNLAIPAPEGTPEEELEIKDGGLNIGKDPGAVKREKASSPPPDQGKKLRHAKTKREKIRFSHRNSSSQRSHRRYAESYRRI